MRTLASLCLLLPLTAAARGDVVVLSPVADAFLSSAQPTSNYGGGGALCVASPGSPNGEFQTLFRFDAATALAAFDASFGAGNWTIQSADLRLTAAAPVAFIFNPQSAGFFALDWLASDSWTEGSGSPANPGSTGITFATLPALLGSTDEFQGIFAFDGSTTASATYTFVPSSGMRADIATGGLVSIRVYTAPGPPPQNIAYVFNSRTNSTTVNRPTLMLTAVANCPADFNHIGGLTVQDIFDFLNAWFAADSAADFNHAGGLTVQDIFDFLNAWFAGC